MNKLIAPKLPGSARFFSFIADLIEKGNRSLRYKIYQHSYLVFSYLPQILVSYTFFMKIGFY
jgi:hypothetical protein